MLNMLAGNWHIATWLISLIAIALILIRPKGWPEAIWAVAGALLLTICGFISPQAALRAAAKGTDVYLFLTGMMIISELARRAGVFDWVATHAVRASRGSPSRLFLLTYAVGVVVTIFLSNDATAVVLTPAVLAAVRAAGADPLPYLLICAFIANAASFVLPISNPANLVVYAGAMPPLRTWLVTFGLASIASILVTFLVLRSVAARYLNGKVKTSLDDVPLRPEGKLALSGIAFLAIVLIVASALGKDLGAPACAVGVLVAIVTSFRDRGTSRGIATGVAWSVLPLVAGLFIIVEALDGAGALRQAVESLNRLKHWQPAAAALGSGFGIAIISNLLNNLPSGLITAAAVRSAHATGSLRDAVLVGVDLGPNLSVTGSLATILWLIAIRREGLDVTFWDFLKWGTLVMPPALLLALLALLR
ncbi:MAG: arsenic transporter [Acidobacteriaceae bacterium]|nr:arsenic transporter [Acidobacteriaceae bacterium]MBV8572541.1 arsenic transporter [Acidobacteriaceae bacterium]